MVFDSEQSPLAKNIQDVVNARDGRAGSMGALLVKMEDRLAIHLDLAVIVDLESLESLLVVEPQHQQQQAFIQLHGLAGGQIGCKQAEKMVGRPAADNAIAERREKVFKIGTVLKDLVETGLRAEVILVEELGPPQVLRGLRKLDLQTLAIPAVSVAFVNEFFEVLERHAASLAAR